MSELPQKIDFDSTASIESVASEFRNTLRVLAEHCQKAEGCEVLTNLHIQESTRRLLYPPHTSNWTKIVGDGVLLIGGAFCGHGISACFTAFSGTSATPSEKTAYVFLLLAGIVLGVVGICIREGFLPKAH